MCRFNLAELLLSLLVHLFLFKSSLTEWRSTNPGGGGAFNSPVITSDGNWVVASDLGGLYFSRNRGKSWYAVGSERGLTVTHVSSLATFTTPNLVVGTDNGIYLSDSRGESVRRVYPHGFEHLYVAAVTVARAKNSIVYAATHESHNGVGATILRSVDSGKSWSIVGSIPAVRALNFRTHPKSPDTLWLVTGEGRFADSHNRAYRSLDGGRNWQVKGPPGNKNVSDIDYAFDKRRPSKMYLTLDWPNTPAFWVSLNNGNTWKYMGSVSSGPSAGAIITNSRKSNFIHVIDANHSIHWQSENSGKSWTSRESSVTGGWSLADEDWGMGVSFQGLLHTIGFQSHDLSNLLWVNGQFVYHSSSGGTKWIDTVSRRVGKNHWISRGIDNVTPFTIEASQADSNLIYVGYADLGIWRSTNAGASWKNLNLVKYTGGWEGKGGNSMTVVSDPSRKNVVWAHMAGNLNERDGFILKSTDRGDTWSEAVSGLPPWRRHIESLVVAEDSNEDWRWLFVIVDGDVYLSENDGSSWSLTLKCGTCVRVTYTEGNGVIAAGPSGLFRNWQGGIPGQWSDITSSLPAEARTGWTKALHWLADLWDYIGPTSITSLGRQNLWISIMGKGVYYSDNFAVSWSLVLRNQFVRHVSVDRKTGHVLVASSSALTAGFYHPDSLGVLTHPSGKSKSGWKKLNQGLAYPFAVQITASKNGQRWCISPGQGVMKWH